MSKANYTTQKMTELRIKYRNKVNSSQNFETYHDLYHTTQRVSGGSGNPNWKNIIRSGGNATSEYQITVTKSNSASGGTGISTGPWDIYTVGDGVFGFVLTPENFGIGDGAIREASAKALSKLRSSFSAGTFLGEAREAMQMLKHPANSLRKLVDKTHKRMRVYQYQALASKRTRRDVANANAALPDLYLEFQFGAKPLGQDIAAAYDALIRMNNSPKDMPFYGTHRVNMKYGREVVFAGNLVTGDRIETWRSINRQITAKVKGAASLKMGFGMPAFQGGSTIPDMVPTIYNLMPWSFLIDYFTNIGHCLEARATASLLEIRWGFTNVKISSDCSFEMIISGGGGVATQTGSIVQFRRTNIGSDFPVPSMDLSDQPLSTAQGFNIAALIASQAADAAVHSKMSDATYG